MRKIQTWRTKISYANACTRALPRSREEHLADEIPRYSTTLKVIRNIKSKHPANRSRPAYNLVPSKHPLASSREALVLKRSPTKRITLIKSSQAFRFRYKHLLSASRSPTVVAQCDWSASSSSAVTDSFATPVFTYARSILVTFVSPYVPYHGRIVFTGRSIGLPTLTSKSWVFFEWIENPFYDYVPLYQSEKPAVVKSGRTGRKSLFPSGCIHSRYMTTGELPESGEPYENQIDRL